MGELARTILRLATGIDIQFSFAIWLLVTVLSVCVGLMSVTLGGRFVNPIAVTILTRPERVALWIPISLAVTLGTVAFLVATVVIAAAGVLVVFAAIGIAALGYFAAALAYGDLAHRYLRGGVHPHPAVAFAIGITLFRGVRLIPFAGALLHTVIVLIGFAAALRVGWEVAISWHRRRMPDHQQFAGEELIEWYPDGDPDDGKPSVGTGRPVHGNIRGEEDRRKPAEGAPAPKRRPKDDSNEG